MSSTGTSYRCDAEEASARAAVEVAFGPLAARPSPLALDGSLAQARPLPPSWPTLPCDTVLSAVLDRAHLVYPAVVPALPAAGLVRVPDGDADPGCGRRRGLLGQCHVDRGQSARRAGRSRCAEDRIVR